MFSASEKDTIKFALEFYIDNVKKEINSILNEEYIEFEEIQNDLETCKKFGILNLMCIINETKGIAQKLNIRL